MYLWLLGAVAELFRGRAGGGEEVAHLPLRPLSVLSPPARLPSAISSQIQCPLAMRALPFSHLLPEGAGCGKAILDAALHTAQETESYQLCRQ